MDIIDKLSDFIEDFDFDSMEKVNYANNVLIDNINFDKPLDINQLKFSCLLYTNRNWKKLLSDIKIKIIDKQGKNISDNSEGEIVVKTPFLTKLFSSHPHSLHNPSNLRLPLGTNVLLSQEDHKGTPYYRIAGPQPRPNPAGAQQNTSAQDAPEDAQNSFRRPTPSLAFYNGYLLVTDAEEMLIDVIETGSGALENLASQEDYQIVAEELSKQSREDSPSMVSFTRPELALKMVFDLVTGENAQGFIAENAESNPLFGALDRAYTDHGIPDYEEIAKYLAPSGALLFNKETGLHFISFSLKPAQP